VTFDSDTTTLDQLKAAVEQAGYGAVAKAGYKVRPEWAAQPIQQPTPVAGTQTAAPVDQRERERQREIDDLRRKSLWSLAAGMAMMALMYLPLNLDLALLAPVMLIVATSIQFWAGRGFYHAAWAAGKHGGANVGLRL
jgi:Cu+-exporting ATPase